MRTHLVYAAFAVALVLVGWLAGSHQPTDAQVTPGVGTVVPGEWHVVPHEMDSSREHVWLYNTATGTTFRLGSFQCEAGADPDYWFGANDTPYCYKVKRVFVRPVPSGTAQSLDQFGNPIWQ